MRTQFCNLEYADPMSELISLKQTTSVEDYYEKFDALLNLLHLIDEYALSVFSSNLKLDISKSVRLFYLKAITHALDLAKQIEVVLYHVPKKPINPNRSTYSTQNNPSHSPVYSKLPHNNPFSMTKLHLYYLFQKSTLILIMLNQIPIPFLSLLLPNQTHKTISNL